MFAQITSIRTPLGMMDSVRQKMTFVYLPIVRVQPGLRRDYFVEQVDDLDHAQLILVWEDQAAYEIFRSSAQATQIYDDLRVLALTVESEGYVVRPAPPTV